MAKDKRLRSFTIDRNTWGRGGTSCQVLRYNGPSARPELSVGPRLCCLGFMAEACGADPSDTHGVQFPCGNDSVAEDVIPKTSPGLRRQFVNLARVNDNPNLTEEERELKVKRIFATYGVRVNFVD